MQLSDLVSAWELPVPVSFRPATGGINNETWYVDTQAGTYVLRIYNRLRAAAKIRYETDLLVHLGQAGLAFGVPSPLPTRSGERIHRFADAEGERHAILVGLIPGAMPDLTDLAPTVVSAGAALGELTLAMGRADIAGDSAMLGRYGDLAIPGLPDPLDNVDRLPVTPEERARMERLVRGVKEQVDAAYATLPQQPIHGDYVPYNLLAEGSRVTGVLDFELAGPDLRPIDLAVGMMAWTHGFWFSGGEWERLEGFTRAYLSQQRLTPAELAALPFLMRLRRTAHFIHTSGRYLLGQISEEIARKGVESGLLVDDWVEAHGAELVRRAIAWAE